MVLSLRNITLEKNALKKLFKDILIIFAITMTLFISSEIMLRIIFPEKISTQEKHVQEDLKDLAYAFNEDYLISLKPNIQKSFLGITWTTNRHSFRGEELDESQDMRIIVYGDSNIQARFSDLQNTFSYKLEKYLEEYLDRNIEVLNAGVVGFGPDQSLIRFTKEVDIFEPNLVIFHIFADNDYGDITRNRLFELDSHGKLIGTSHPRELDAALKVKSIRKKIVTFLSSLLLVRSTKKVLGFIAPEKFKTLDDSDLIQRYMHSIKAEYAVYKHKKPKYFSHFADYYDLDVAAFPNAESSTIKVKLMEGVLKKANTVAAAKSVEFMVLIQPSVVDLTENSSMSYKDLQQYPGYIKTNLTDTIDNICEMNNIHKINLFDVFLRNNPQDLFFKGGSNHWNNRGQDVAAREASSYISSNILMKMN